MNEQAFNEKDAYIRSVEQRVAAFYERSASTQDVWLRRNRYYYDRQHRILRHILPAPGSVLEIGCGVGHCLNALDPQEGMGIDISEAMVNEARRRHPRFEFRQMSAMDCHALERTFDTIILVNSLTEIPDPVLFFKRLRSLCTPRTRVFQMSYNYLWEPVLQIGARIGLHQRHPVENWFSRCDYENVFKLAGFEIVREGHDLLFPKGVPFVAQFCNQVMTNVPLIKHASMLYYCVARPLAMEQSPESYAASIVIPCRNEDKNIPGMVDRIPDLGRGTEIIFVDDASTDDTASAVEHERVRHPGRAIKLVRGPGKGKGAAVRAGFAEATGDVFMILDADLAVMPEALPEFWDAIVSGKGEFINGSRLMYPMEETAMRTLNIIGNKFFALMFSFLLAQRFKDTLCGTKVIWRSDYAKILASRAYFGDADVWGDYDWLFGAARNNLQIVELPVHYRVRTAGQTKMTHRLRNAWIMLKMCFRALTKLKLI